MVLSITEYISEEANEEPLVLVSEEKVGKAATKETTKLIVLHKFLIKYYPYGAFNTRHNKLHMLVNKSNWHKLATNAMNGKVTRDVAKAAEVLITTNENPHTFELVLPALLTLVKNGMTEVKSSNEHKPGQLLNVVTDIEKFKKFKIIKTGSGNEREIEINGRKVASGDHTLTDNSFSTKVTLGSDWIEPRTTWGRKLPTPQAETNVSYLKNLAKRRYVTSVFLFIKILVWGWQNPYLGL